MTLAMEGQTQRRVVCIGVWTTRERALSLVYKKMAYRRRELCRMNPPFVRRYVPKTLDETLKILSDVRRRTASVLAKRWS